MRNFDYLRDVDSLWDLRLCCEAAEAECRSKYDVSALNCRRALEWLVKTLYQHKHIELPERASLYELMLAVRKVDNAGAHDGAVSRKEAFFCVLNLYNVGFLHNVIVA